MFYRLLTLFLIPLIALEPFECKRRVLMVLYDGFRWDLPDITQAAHLKKLASQGVRAQYMNPAVPTLTSPAIWTLATGLHPENHGVILNGDFNRTTVLNYGDSLTDKNWWSYKNVEPVWTTARKQGKKVRLSRIPGMVNGFDPKTDIPDWEGDDSINYYQRVLQAFKWFRDDDVDMAMIYFPEPDWTAHSSGGDGSSPALWAKIRACDDVIGYIFWLLKRFKMEGEVDVIVTADHGTAQPGKLGWINPFVYSDMRDIDYVVMTSYITMIQPRRGKLETLYRQMKSIDSNNLKVYKKAEFPSGWHWAGSHRVLPLIVVSEYGYLLTNQNATWSSKPGVVAPVQWKGGAHGWLTHHLDMKPIFYAMGPSFKSGYDSWPFDSVHVYSLLCYLLGVKPAQNDGSLSSVSDILKEAPASNFVGVG